MPDRYAARPGERSDYWASLLEGEGGLELFQRVMRKIPTAPRCKLCQAPFAGPVAPLLRLAGFRRWSLNQQICRVCVRDLEKHQGGAEIPVSLLYVDVRGSTALAETMSATDFTDSLNQFYAVASKAIDAELGVIDHIAGDGVMALWIPAFVGTSHPRHAVAAGMRITEELARPGEDGAQIPAGVAVHTGQAYVGVVGQPGARDFTVLGDIPNTVARLSSSAGAGQLVISEAIAAGADIDTTGLAHREFTLKGKAEPFPAWVWTVDGERLWSQH